MRARLPENGGLADAHQVICGRVKKKRRPRALAPGRLVIAGGGDSPYKGKPTVCTQRLTNIGITFLRCVIWHQPFELTTPLFSMDLDLEGI